MLGFLKKKPLNQKLTLSIYYLVPQQTFRIMHRSEIFPDFLHQQLTGHRLLQQLSVCCLVWVNQLV